MPVSMPGASRVSLLLGCAALFAAVTLIQPAYFPLLEADSTSYLDFHSSRTAIYPVFLRVMGQLGLSPERIAYSQVALFSLALMVLLAALLRAGISRPMILLTALALALNGYFSSLLRTILSESIFVSGMALTVAFWID